MTERYDDSEAGLFRQVDAAEIDALLAAGIRPFGRDVRKLTHLLTRVRSTLVAAHETVTGLRQYANEQSAHLARVGTATTLNPLDALQYLDDEQKELIFDRLTRSRLAALRALVTRAQLEQSAVEGELAVVRGTAEALASRADLPPHVRAEVTRMLAALPARATNVHYPPMLDYPDPEPLVPAVSVARAAPVVPSPMPAPAPVPVPEPVSEPAATSPPAVVAFVDPWAPAAVKYVDPYGARKAPPEPPATNPGSS